MRFKVVGADAESGDDVDLILEAASQPDVEKLAHDKHILVSLITPVSPGAHTAGAAHAPAGAKAEHGGKSKDLEAISLIEDEPSPGGNGAHHAAGLITLSAGSPSDKAKTTDGHTPEAKHSEAAMEYHIMLNQSLYLLETAVNKQIKEGWEPQGGVSIAVSNNALQYFQSLIRRKKTPDAAHAAAAAPDAHAAPGGQPGQPPAPH